MLITTDAQIRENIFDPEDLIAGVDEVGRGALFGPVVVGVVVMPVSQLDNLIEIGVKDSKQLSPKKRKELSEKIKILANTYQISYASVKEIDRINILQATLLAMKRGINKLIVKPELCLVDGNQKIPDVTVVQKTIIGGDRRFAIIAAASIIAKVWRDDLMVRLDSKYPQYDLANNKGYGTQKHRLALQKYGPSWHHRLSFRPCSISTGDRIN
ncbi:ribonuclease HII [Aphanothece sacrum]|uniref:Ribonuclease HII n=1 Tax=Aphanothece sacrum FPU1 TaxID=1920663 RepID=A0A401ICE9_APHSA|nr:ribonuclease HII [Aphanothece sacrum]GBF78935.1 ribonuclease HII [Aphanothece sacrum FPU1]GBF86718.1 ribonuclease HII [Aphanothece sacrum FPU3]